MVKEKENTRERYIDEAQKDHQTQIKYATKITLQTLLDISPLICHGYVLGVLQPIKNEQRSRNARWNVIVGLDTEYP